MSISLILFQYQNVVKQMEKNKTKNHDIISFRNKIPLSLPVIHEEPDIENKNKHKDKNKKKEIYNDIDNNSIEDKLRFKNRFGLPWPNGFAFSFEFGKQN